MKVNMKADMKISFIKNNKLVKLGFLIFLFLFIFNFFITAKNTVQAQNSKETSIAELENLSNSETGLITCNPFSDNPEDRCTLKAATKLFLKLWYASIIIMGFGLIILTIYFLIQSLISGNSPEVLAKYKQSIWKAVKAIAIVVLGIPVLMAILAGVGLKKEILEIVNEFLSSNNNFNIFPTAFAETASSSGGYISPFPGQKIVSAFLIIIKIAINYIVAPILVGFTIYSGYLFVKAQGNAAELQKAKSFLGRVVIWIIIVASVSIATGIIMETTKDVAEKIKIESK